MKVQIVATQDCPHRPNLERELEDLGVPFELVFVEDQPGLAERLNIRHSPNLVVFRGQPSEAELSAFFSGGR
jgi:glutaredoxin